MKGRVSLNPRPGKVQVRRHVQARVTGDAHRATWPASAGRTCAATAPQRRGRARGGPASRGRTAATRRMRCGGLAKLTRDFRKLRHLRLQGHVGSHPNQSAHTRMTQLRAVLRLDIGELLVQTHELGREYELSVDPPVRLLLPEAPTQDEPQGEDFGGGGIGIYGDLPALLSVRIVQMTVDLEDDLSAADFADGNTDAWPRERFYDVVNQAETSALNSYKLLRAWARVGGTQQRGAAYEEPEILGVELLDLDAEVQLPLAMGGAASAVARTLGRGEREQLHSLTTTVLFVQSGDTPPLAEVLLADARALPVLPGASDPLRDLLLCAIACEVKVKTRLLELATPERAPLIEIIIANPREVVQSVPQLLHKTCRAITGRSLNHDDPELYQAVERLFKRRNDIAHRGKLTTAEQDDNPENTATHLFAWLDALEAA